MPRTKTLKASQRNIRSESMIAISPFKLRKHARRRPARTSAKDMREEWKLDSQNLKSAVRVDEKGRSLTRRKKRQFGLNDPRVFAHTSSCGFGTTVARSFRC